MKNKNKIDFKKITDKAFDGPEFKKCLDDLVVFGCYATKTEVIDGAVVTKNVDLDDPDLSHFFKNT